MCLLCALSPLEVLPCSLLFLFYATAHENGNELPFRITTHNVTYDVNLTGKPMDFFFITVSVEFRLTDGPAREFLQRRLWQRRHCLRWQEALTTFPTYYISRVKTSSRTGSQFVFH